MKKVNLRFLKEYYYKTKKFGFRISLWDMLSRLIPKRDFLKKKHMAILDFLKVNFSKEINEVILENQNLQEEEIKEDSPIWIFWWQGLDNAPELVKTCVKSVQEHAGKHIVNYIDGQNWSSYITLPERVIYEFKQKKMSVVHLSDIIRITLMQKYGGIWLDATIFLADSLDKDIVGLHWYSQKSLVDEMKKEKYVSQYKWSTFFFACGKNNRVLNFHKKIFDAYLERYDMVIDYFLQDYIFRLAYESDRNVKVEIDDVKPNNPDIFWLQQRIKEKYDEVAYTKVRQNTKIFKLTYRINGEIEKESFYDKLIQGILK